MIQQLKSKDSITVNLFGKEVRICVFSTGDNQFDEEGNYKSEGFALSETEIACLNWFIENVDIADYKREIIAYCNAQYDAIGGAQITEAMLENEVSLSGIAINICQITQSDDGFVYPEIAFCGECACDPEHGICIGFRDKKFLGIGSFDWVV